MLHRLFLVYQPNIVAETMTSVMHKCYVSKMENVQNIRRVMLSLQTIRFSQILFGTVSRTGISSDFKISLTASRTQQLCVAMTVSKDLMANLLLAVGGRGGISSGGDGSNGELTNWDGTKKKTGWGVS